MQSEIPKARTEWLSQNTGRRTGNRELRLENLDRRIENKRERRTLLKGQRKDGTKDKGVENTNSR